ncbi:MAG: HAD family hydrolase [Cyanobacteriota bacterium]|jgi:phosphoglycolate phosphatase
MAVLLLRGEPLLSAGEPADIQAVLFDKDGTMSRSEPHLLALSTARLQHCVRLHGPCRSEELSELLARTYGLHPGMASLNPAGITAVAARDHNLIGTAVALTQVGHGWPESLLMAEEAFRLADMDTPSVSRTSQLTEGLVDLLRDLRHTGVLCAVISNDDSSGIQTFLGEHGLSEAFSAIWSAEHRPRKPDPQAVHALCATLGVAPSCSALIGDANSDLRMARAAGIALAIGYRGGWQQALALAEGYPCVDHWRELLVGEAREPALGVSTETHDTQQGT